MRDKTLKAIALCRFIDEFDGSATELRSAISREFDVTLRTVESELPRLVERGLVIEETLPGRGGPKRYQVSQAMRERLDEMRFVTLAEMLAWGDLPVVKDRYARLLDYLAETEGESMARTFDQLFRDGRAAYCDACVPHLGKTSDLSYATALSPAIPYQPGILDPVCHRHGILVQTESSGEESRQGAGRLGEFGGATSTAETWRHEDYEPATQESGRWVPKPMETAFTLGLLADGREDDAQGVQSAEERREEERARHNERIMEMVRRGAGGLNTSSYPHDGHYVEELPQRYP